jgi:hypothetical protein
VHVFKRETRMMVLWNSMLRFALFPIETIRKQQGRHVDVSFCYCCWNTTLTFGPFTITTWKGYWRLGKRRLGICKAKHKETEFEYCVKHIELNPTWLSEQTAEQSVCIGGSLHTRLPSRPPVSVCLPTYLVHWMAHGLSSTFGSYSTYQESPHL